MEFNPRTNLHYFTYNSLPKTLVLILVYFHSKAGVNQFFNYSYFSLERIAGNDDKYYFVRKENDTISNGTFKLNSRDNQIFDDNSNHIGYEDLELIDRYIGAEYYALFLSFGNHS